MMELTRSLDQPLRDKVDPSALPGDSWAGALSPRAARTRVQAARPSPAHASWPVSAAPIPVVTCPALWELSLNNTLMEKIMKNQIIAAGRELKPFFIPRVPGPRLRAPPWERAPSQPSLWPAIAGADYSCNSPLIGSGTPTAIKARRSACRPSRGLPAAPPTAGRRGARAGPPRFGLLPPPGPGHSNWGTPAISALHPPTLLHPAGSYLPCGAQRQRLFLWEASLDAPVGGGGLAASFTFSGLPSLSIKWGCQQEPPH